MSGAPHRLFAVVAIVAVTAAVVWGFVVVGSPAERRLEKLDERRVHDLRAIVAEMQGLVYDHDSDTLRRPLFEDLASLAKEARRRRLTIVDPQTGNPYAYRVLGPHRYELCAEFDTGRDGAQAVFWNHPAGKHCFVIDVQNPP